MTICQLTDSCKTYESHQSELGSNTGKMGPQHFGLFLGGRQHPFQQLAPFNFWGCCNADLKDEFKGVGDVAGHTLWLSHQGSDLHVYSPLRKYNQQVGDRRPCAAR